MRPGADLPPPAATAALIELAGGSDSGVAAGGLNAHQAAASAGKKTRRRAVWRAIRESWQRRRPGPALVPAVHAFPARLLGSKQRTRARAWRGECRSSAKGGCAAGSWRHWSRRWSRWSKTAAIEDNIADLRAAARALRAMQALQARACARTGSARSADPPLLLLPEGFLAAAAALSAALWSVWTQFPVPGARAALRSIPIGAAVAREVSLSPAQLVRSRPGGPAAARRAPLRRPQFLKPLLRLSPPEHHPWLLAGGKRARAPGAGLNSYDVGRPPGQDPGFNPSHR